MKRKVNRVGTGTLTISLPSKWAEQNHITLGSELEVKEEGAQITFSTTEIKKDSKRISFHVDHPIHRGARKYLYYAYKEGYDEIEITIDSPETLARVIKEVNSLLGFEIIRQTDKYCLIKNVASPLDSTFPDLINKAFQITLSMSEETLQAFKNKDYSSLAEISEQEFVQNKLINTSLRMINSNQFKIRNCGSLYTMVSILEGIADRMKYICQHYKDKKVPLDKETEDYFEYYLSSLKEAYEEFHTFDEEKALSNGVRKSHFYKESCQNILIKCKNEHKLLVNFLNAAGLYVCDLRDEIYLLNKSRPKGTKGIFDSINLT
ncbi:MAG: hypothetical protein WCV90_01995 [Candidatus Woesearchaeota archaeon]